MTYLYLDSNTSDHLYPNNATDNFRVKLPKVLNFDQYGGYRVALLDIDLPRFVGSYTPEHVTLYCSLCQPSVCNSEYRQVLHRLYMPSIRGGRPLQLETPRYVPVNAGIVESLHFFILDQDDRPPPFRPGHLTCTLHIEKKGKCL